MPYSRRDVLRLGAAAGAMLLSRRAGAIGAGSKFRFAQLQLGERWDPRPNALRKMAWEVQKRTAIDVDTNPRVVTLGSDKLHETPLLYLAGDREFDLPAQDHIEALRRFLTFGGFLIVDSAEGSTDGAFDHSVRRLIEAVYPPPGKTFEIVPSEHVAFQSFYLLDRAHGRVAISPVMEAVMRDGRLVAVYIQNDLGGAFARDAFGNYELQCVPGGERQRELAFRTIVNLVMYALCLDYKADQVHVPFIMKRRRWRPDDDATALDGPE